MGTPDRTLGALGLCAKARALVCGTPMVCEALAGRRKPMLAVLAADNSAATDKRLEDKCRYYGVPTVRIAQDGEALARAVGKSGRLAAVRPLLARLQQLAGQAGGDSFSILLQVLAIAFVAQLAADLCREAGLSAAAFCMEFVGRILAMLQALPLLQSLLASFLSFLS